MDSSIVELKPWAHSQSLHFVVAMLINVAHFPAGTEALSQIARVFKGMDEVLRIRRKPTGMNPVEGKSDVKLFYIHLSSYVYGPH